MVGQSGARRKMASRAILLDWSSGGSCGLLFLISSAANNHIVNLLKVNGLRIHGLGLGVFPLVVHPAAALFFGGLHNVHREGLPIGVLNYHEILTHQVSLGMG